MHIQMSHRVPQTVVPWLGFSWIAPGVLCDLAKRWLPLTTHHHPSRVYSLLGLLLLPSPFHTVSAIRMAWILQTGVFTNPKCSDKVMLGNHHTARSNRKVLPAAAAKGQDTAWWHSEHEDVFQHGSESITKDSWTLIPDLIALNKIIQD